MEESFVSIVRPAVDLICAGGFLTLAIISKARGRGAGGGGHGAGSSSLCRAQLVNTHSWGCLKEIMRKGSTVDIGHKGLQGPEL